MNNKKLFEKFNEGLAATAQSASEWFIESSIKKSREDYESRGKLGDNGEGAVYAYIGRNNKIIYIGETSRNIKARQHDQKSPHKKQKWWKDWSEIRFLEVCDRTDRITLELLLILYLNPRENTKPGYRKISNMFKGG